MFLDHFGKVSHSFGNIENNKTEIF